MYNISMSKWDIGALNRGKNLSEKTKKKISLKIKTLVENGSLKITNKGERLSEEHKKKISQSRKGIAPWNKNKTGVMPPAWNIGQHWSNEVKKKISESKKGKPAHNKGIPRTEAEKEKMRIAAKKMWERRKKHAID